MTTLVRNTISVLPFWLFCNIFNDILGDLQFTSNNSTHVNSIGFNYTKNELVLNQQHQPSFENDQNVNLTVLENESVILFCAVRHKGNKTVSWIRREDIHILTSEDFVFSGEKKFTVIHPKDSIEWNLKIDHVTLKDSGFYECQVNTEPKIKKIVYLEVTVPEVLQERAIASANSFNGKIKFAKITGSSELHIKVGSTISLTCTVNHQVPSIQWFHNDHAIEFSSNRGGINLETEKNSEGTISRLLLTRAQLRDNGNYSCLPLGALPASVIVHVLNDEYPAAKYMSSAVTYSSSTGITMSCATTTLLILFYQRFASKKVVNFFFS